MMAEIEGLNGDDGSVEAAKLFARISREYSGCTFAQAVAIVEYMQQNRKVAAKKMGERLLSDNKKMDDIVRAANLSHRKAGVYDVKVEEVTLGETKDLVDSVFGLAQRLLTLQPGHVRFLLTTEYNRFKEDMAKIEQEAHEENLSKDVVKRKKTDLQMRYIQNAELMAGYISRQYTADTDHYE